MIPMLTSKYYLIRIAKSKGMIDLTDAIDAYLAFRRDRFNEAHRQYCQSVKQGDIGTATSAMLLMMY